MTASRLEPTAPELGTRFRWIRHLGRGGHGRVELVHDRKRNEQVALKLLDESSSAAVLKREFRLLRDVAHPHLVSMLELLIEPQLECLVLEFIDGVDLLQHLGASAAAHGETRTRTAGGTGSDEVSDLHGMTAHPERVAPAFLQLAHALQFLEDRGLVHGDLKPENVLVERGRVVVLDFGIARLRGAPGSRPIGTLPYMAPEQLSAGATLTGAVDRYAVGVLLHRALAGHLPFVGTPDQIRAAKRRTPPLLGRAPLQELAHALLSYEPEARPDLSTIQRIFEHELGLPSLRREAPRPAPLGVRSGARELVGRASELSRLGACLSADRIGFLVGGPGLGKTAILDRFCSDHEPRVLRSRCYANEAIRWNAIDGFVDALVADGAAPGGRDSVAIDALARLFPALRAPGEGPQPDQPVVELVKRAARGFGSLVAAHGRAVLVVDDAQWADADSMSFLVELLRAHAHLSAILATRGPDARSAEILERLVSVGRGVDTIELAPLPEDDAAELARRLGDGADTLPRELVTRATGGVPFLIEELAWAAQKRGAGPRDVDDAASLLSARLADIDPASRRLLSCLAVNDAPLEPDILFAAAGDVGQKTVLRLVTERLCRIDHVLGAEEQRVDVFHDSIRRELLASMSASTRREAHAALAESTLCLRKARNDDIARHLLAARDPRAARFALAAADDARAVFAFERAASWLGRALDLPLAPGQAESTRRLLAECHRLAEHHTEAARVLEALAASEGAAAAIDTRRQAAEQWLTAGELERGLAILEELYVDGKLAGVGIAGRPLWRLLFERAKIRARGMKGLRVRPAPVTMGPQAAPNPGPPSSGLVTMGPQAAPNPGPAEPATKREPRAVDLLTRVDLAWTVSGCFALIDPVRAGAVHAEALGVAVRAGDPERALRALVGETIYSGMFGSRGRTRTDLLLAAIERLADDLDSHARGLVTSTRSVVEVQRGNFEEGAALTRVGLELLLNHPKTVGWELMAARHFHMHALYYLGRYDELVRHVEAEYRESSARSNRHRMVDVSLHHASMAWLLSHGPAVARQRAARATQFWSGIGSKVQAYYSLASSITIALWEGDGEGAWRALARPSAYLTAPIFVAEGLRIDALHTVARAALAHAAKGRSLGAATLALAWTALLSAERAPHAAPLARLQLAGLANAWGARDTAERLARRAAADLRRQGLLGYAEAAESFHGGRTHAGPRISEPLARVLAPGLALFI